MSGHMVVSILFLAFLVLFLLVIISLNHSDGPVAFAAWMHPVIIPFDVYQLTREAFQKVSR